MTTRSRDANGARLEVVREHVRAHPLTIARAYGRTLIRSVAGARRTVKSIHAIGALLLGAASLALVACADLRDIMSLQQGLAREFDNPAVSVNMHNNAHLTVTFSNSPAAELPENERAAFARRVAEYARDHYAGYDRLQTVSVGFAAVRGGGGLTVTKSSVPYRFAAGELGSPKVGAKDVLKDKGR